MEPVTDDTWEKLAADMRAWPRAPKYAMEEFAARVEALGKMSEAEQDKELQARLNQAISDVKVPHFDESITMRLPVPAQVEALGKRSLDLDEYEAANLLAALSAALPSSHSTVPDVPRSPLEVLNNGDWTGQIYWKLAAMVPRGQTVNMTPQQLADAARRWKESQG